MMHAAYGAFVGGGVQVHRKPASGLSTLIGWVNPVRSKAIYRLSYEAIRHADYSAFAEVRTD